MLSSITLAQIDVDTSPVITAANIQTFQPVASIDFDTLPADFLSGWFAMNAAGTQFAIRSTDETVWIIDENSKLLTEPIAIQPDGDFNAQFIDAAFSDNGLTLIFDAGQQLYRVHDTLNPENPERTIQALNLEATVLAIWKDCDTNSCQTWLEILPDDPEIPPSVVELAENGDISQQHPYAPVQDTAASVRVGRVAPPYAVTSSADGLVKLWDVQTGETIAEVQHTEIVPSGNINARAEQLVWRDANNEHLYLMDFASGENQHIGTLSGQYAQWLFLSPAADLALAINLDFEPVIVAWDIASSSELLRTPYRTCERLPDMARLSMDGTTLVIGCDTGLDIWRILPDF